jgi:antitoxin HigA-1
MSAAEVARQLNVPTNRVTGILDGQRAVTGETALRLGHFLGTSGEFWLNLQSLYELRLAKQEAVEGIRALPTLKRGRTGASRPTHEPAQIRAGQNRGRTASSNGYHRQPRKT